MDFKYTKLSWSRPVTSYAKVQQCYSWVARNRLRFANLKTSGLVLNVGCGPNSDPSCLNLDYAWLPGIDICWDLHFDLPLPDSYSSAVFTEHCLEHLPLNITARVLEEFYRVVIPGGVVRLVVPDLGIYVAAYNALLAGEETTMPYAESDAIDGLYCPAMSVNRIMRAHEHQFIYDFDTMSKLLLRAGFSSPQKLQYAKGRLGHMDTAHRAAESLYVEAVKLG